MKLIEITRYYPVGGTKDRFLFIDPIKAAKKFNEIIESMGEVKKYSRGDNKNAFVNNQGDLLAEVETVFTIDE